MFTYAFGAEKGERTLTNHGTSVTALDLKHIISETEELENVDFRLVHNGRDIPNDARPFEQASTSCLHFRVFMDLKGGKGGFGSMLRAMGNQRSGFETDIVDSCRDLNGRRLRHVQDEKKLAQWRAKQHIRDAEARRKKQMKLEKALIEPKINFNHHGLVVELHEASAAVGESVKAGFEKSTNLQKKRLGEETQVLTKRRKCGPWDNSDISESDEPTSSSTTTSSSASAATTTTMEGKNKDKGKGKQQITIVSVGPPSTTSRTTSTVSTAGLLPTPQPTPTTKTQPHQTSTTTAPPTTTTTTASSKKTATTTANSNNTSVTSSAKTTATTSSKSEPRGPVVAKALSLDDITSEKQLVALGLDRLKAALMAEALKCGGSLEERASRLFSIKGLSRSQYPQEILAKSMKKKKR